MNTSSRLNQAAAIREVLLDMGLQTQPREVIRHLKESKGVEVSPQQVSNEKAKLAKRGSILQIQDLPVSVVKKVKSLVDELGSTQVVRKALDELDELRSAEK